MGGRQEKLVHQRINGYNYNMVPYFVFTSSNVLIMNQCIVSHVVMRIRSKLDNNNR